MATVAPDQVLSAAGLIARATAFAAKGGDFACDLVVMCGPRVPDAGLLASGRRRSSRGTKSAERSCRSDLPANVTRGGRSHGRRSLAPVCTPPEITRHKRSFVCLCYRRQHARILRDGIAEGFDQIETLKRYTTLTMGPCQGRMCQLSAIGVCARETGRTHGRDRRHHLAAAESLGHAGRAGGAAASSHPPHAHALRARRVRAPSGWTWANGSGRATTRAARAAPSGSASRRNIEPCASASD